MREQQLNLFPFTARDDGGLRFGDFVGKIASAFVATTRHFAGLRVGRAARFERTAIAVIFARPGISEGACRSRQCR